MTDSMLPPPPPRPPSPQRSPEMDAKGSRAAWLIFGIFAWADVSISIFSRGDARMMGLFAADLAMVVLGPVLGLVAHFVLPRESRYSFWMTGLLCMGLMVLLWGITCGVAFNGFRIP
jgi:hypothetical protein